MFLSWGLSHDLLKSAQRLPLTLSGSSRILVVTCMSPNFGVLTIRQLVRAPGRDTDISRAASTSPEGHGDVSDLLQVPVSLHQLLGEPL